MTDIAKYESILLAIPQLSGKQLEEIRKRCNATLALRAPGKTAVSDDWLLRGFQRELVNRGLDEPREVRVKVSNTAFITQSERVRAILEKGAPGLDRNELLALGELVAECLADYIQSWDKSGLSLGTMMRNVSRVPEAVDRAFPGYLQAGFLGMVINGRW